MALLNRVSDVEHGASRVQETADWAAVPSTPSGGPHWRREKVPDTRAEPSITNPEITKSRTRELANP
ncbi:hypothetical protein N7462_010951 [Penicillium macrosclerotiorum]|uniref:uncharacterized protein n=1 Tax=Penicillium macrosclerotiorum TaxID=303699 RepID=UPI002548E63F|nr:uncharacterized protein N7462_010951 [Penicillium macrosclerotiorum]KAJ5669881.1 hypothetical protein N7462_010951 [Penicillium macrosclerotiorum]